MICSRKDRTLLYDIDPVPTASSSSRSNTMGQSDYNDDGFSHDYSSVSDSASGISTRSCLSFKLPGQKRNNTRRRQQQQHYQQQTKRHGGIVQSDSADMSSSQQSNPTRSLLSPRKMRADPYMWTNSTTSSQDKEDQHNFRPVSEYKNSAVGDSFPISSMSLSRAATAVTTTPEKDLDKPTSPISTELLSLPTPTDRSHKRRLKYEQETRRKAVYDGELEPEGIRGQEAAPATAASSKFQSSTPSTTASSTQSIPLRRSFDKPRTSATAMVTPSPPRNGAPQSKQIDADQSTTSSQDIKEMMDDLDMLNETREDKGHSALLADIPKQGSQSPSFAAAVSSNQSPSVTPTPRRTPVNWMSPTPALTSTHGPDIRRRRSRTPTRRQEELHRELHRTISESSPLSDTDDDKKRSTRGSDKFSESTKAETGAHLETMNFREADAVGTKPFGTGAAHSLSPSRGMNHFSDLSTISSKPTPQRQDRSQQLPENATSKPASADNHTSLHSESDLSNAVKRSTAPVDTDDSSFVEPFSNVEGIHAMAMEHVLHGEYDMALQAFGQVLSVYKAQYGPAHPLVASAHHNLGTVHSKRAALLIDHTMHQRHCREQAMLSFQAAARSARDSLGRNHPNVAVSLVRIGFLLLSSRQFQNAIVTFQEALRIRLVHFGDNHALVANLYNNLGVCHMHLGEFAIGREQLGKALSIQKQLMRDEMGCTSEDFRSSLLEVADTLCNIGGLCLEWIRQQGPDARHAMDAESAFLEALELRSKVLGPTDPLVLQVRSLHDMVRSIPLPTSVSPKGRHYGRGSGASTPTSEGRRPSASYSPANSRQHSPRRPRTPDSSNARRTPPRLIRRPSEEQPLTARQSGESHLSRSPSRYSHSTSVSRSPPSLQLPTLSQPPKSPLGHRSNDLISQLTEPTIEELKPKVQHNQYHEPILKTTSSSSTSKMFNTGSTLNPESSFLTDEEISQKDTAASKRDSTNVFRSPHYVPKTATSPDQSGSDLFSEKRMPSQYTFPSSTAKPSNEDSNLISTKFSYDAEESCLLSNKARGKEGKASAEDDPFHWSKYDELSGVPLSTSDGEVKASENPKRSTEIMVVFPRGGGDREGRSRQHPQPHDDPQPHDEGDEKKDDAVPHHAVKGSNRGQTSSGDSMTSQPKLPSTASMSPGIGTAMFSSYSLNPRSPASTTLPDASRSSNTEEDRESCLLRAKAILEAHREFLESPSVEFEDKSSEHAISPTTFSVKGHTKHGSNNESSAKKYGEELGQDDGLAPLGGTWPNTAAVDDAGVVTADMLDEPEKYLHAIHTGAARYLKKNRFGEALHLFEIVLDCQRKRHGPLHEDVGAALHNVGIGNLRMEHHTTALQIFEEAVRVRQGALGRDHPQVAVSLVKVGITLLLLRRFEDSLWVFREALDVRKSALGALHPSTARIYNNIGCVHVEFQELREARRAFEAALDIQRNALCHDPDSGPILFGAATTLCNLGYLYKTRDMHEKAALVLREALNLQEKVLGKQHPTVLSTLDSLAEACATSNHATHALKYYNEILERFHRGGAGSSQCFGSNKRRKRAEAVLLYKMSHVHRQHNDLQSQLSKLKQSLAAVRSIKGLSESENTPMSQAEQEQHANLEKRIEKELRVVKEELDKVGHELQWI